ncbi:hypothetical protein MJD09_01435 [bacterium]|nr:hypothetical protein [bacterium]
MTRRNISIVILIALVAGTIIYGRSVNINLPGNNQGFAPEQPIAFSHRLHSGDLQMDCLYCHTGADKSRHAGTPPASICMNCHQFVTSSWDQVKIEEQKAQEENRDMQLPVSAELAKLYAAVGFDTDKMQYDPASSGKPIQWTRVHSLPAYAYFDHRRHVNADVSCQQCHGPVETMETVSQDSDLSMGWCVNCHRDANAGVFPDIQTSEASTNCVACRY